MMNELDRNQYDVTNHQVNVQFLLQLQLEWKRFVTLVKQSQELKIVSCHKLYDILKHHHNEVNKIRDERLAHTANPVALVAQQQPVYHPQNHPNHYTQNSLTKAQQVATRNKGKVIVNSSRPTYDQEPTMVAEDDEMLKEKEFDKPMALIFLSFKKIYKPTNNNLRTSSNTSRANQDNSLRINRGISYDNQRVVKIAWARENVEQADWMDDTDDKPEDQELEAHYLYMDYIDLGRERELLASLIEKLKCKIDDSKNCNKFLESSNKALADKLKAKIKEFKTKNKSLESPNNHFKEETMNFQRLVS
nr:hypothetical protein [Tanacetum cinerariifolium]